jgi:hypothetical protein
MRALRVLLPPALLACALSLPVAPSPARAQGLHVPFFERLFGSRPAPPNFIEVPQRAPRADRRDASKPKARAKPRLREPRVVRIKPEAVAPAAVEAVETPKTFFVAVLGDAMALMLADGLTESLARERPQVAILRKGRDSSGVVREDYYDWRKAARDLVVGGDRIDYALVMMGANDRQPMRGADGQLLETLSDGWAEVYAARVAEIVATLRGRGAPVAWVGLPIMRSERYSADIRRINEIARAAAEKAGGTFIETWDRFSDESGAYDADGPDVNGQITRLRRPDGIYFTHAGVMKLAHFVEGDVARLAGAPAPPTTTVKAAPGPTAPLAVAPDALAPPLVDPAEIDAGALVRMAAREEEAARAGLSLPGVALPEALPAPVFPTRPAAGPVAPLTAPPVAADGKLAAAPAPRPALSTDPRPGRADDFAWPSR